MLTGFLSHGQESCSFQVRISSNVIAKGVMLDTILLPSTACLFDNAKVEISDGFYYSTIDSNSLCSEFTSHLSPEFCKIRNQF